MKSQSKRAVRGGARLLGNATDAVAAVFLSRWMKAVVQGCSVYGPKDGILSMTTGPSIQVRECGVLKELSDRGER